MKNINSYVNGTVMRIAPATKNDSKLELTGQNLQEILDCIDNKNKIDKVMFKNVKFSESVGNGLSFTGFIDKLFDNKYPNITRVEFHDIGADIDDDKAIHIANALARNNTIKTFMLEDTGCGILGARAFGIALAQNHTLESLVIRNNDFYTEGANYIISGLKNNKSLRKLDIRDCMPDITTYRILEYVLKAGCPLNSVNLEYESFCAKKIRSDITIGLTDDAKGCAAKAALIALRNSIISLLNPDMPQLAPVTSAPHSTLMKPSAFQPSTSSANQQQNSQRYHPYSRS